MEGEVLQPRIENVPLVCLLYTLSNYVSRKWCNFLLFAKILLLLLGSLQKKMFVDYFLVMGKLQTKKKRTMMSPRHWLKGYESIPLVQCDTNGGATEAEKKSAWWKKKSGRLWIWAAIWQKLFVRFPRFRQNSDKCKSSGLKDGPTPLKCFG